MLNPGFDRMCLTLRGSSLNFSDRSTTFVTASSILTSTLVVVVVVVIEVVTFVVVVVVAVELLEVLVVLSVSTASPILLDSRCL